MIAIIIYGLIAVTIAGTVGMTIVLSMQATNSLSLTQQNSANLDRLAILVESSLRSVNDDGIPYAPAGTSATPPTGSSYTGLPAWLSVNRNTPWGVPYSYCPYAPNSVAPVSGAQITEGDGTTTYDIDTVTWPSGSGRDYVTRSKVPSSGSPVPSSLADTDIVALILSPLPGEDMVPNCSDVSISSETGQPIVADGIATAVYRSQGNSQQSIGTAFRPVLHVAPDATVSGYDASNPANGSSPYSATTLAAALERWKTVAPRYTILDLADGSYSLSASESDLTSAAELDKKSRLKITGSGAGNASISLSADFAIKTPTQLEGVTITNSQVVATQTDLDLKNVTVSAVQIVSGSLEISGTVTTTGSSYTNGISLYDSKLHLDGALDISADQNGVNLLTSEAILFPGSTLSVSADNYAIDIAAGSELIADGGNGSAPVMELSPGGAAGGVLLMRGDRLFVNDGIVRATGATTYGIRHISGRVDLSGDSRIGGTSGGGVSPSVGYSDDGGDHIRGDNSVYVYGTTCFESTSAGILFGPNYTTDENAGKIFPDEPIDSIRPETSGTEGILEGSLALDLTNRASWTCK